MQSVFTFPSSGLITQNGTTSTKKKHPLPLTPRSFLPEKTLIYQQGQEKTQLVRPFTQEHLTYFLDEKWTLNLSTANELLAKHHLEIVFRHSKDNGSKTIHLEEQNSQST